MNFLIDESVDAVIADQLRNAGHGVTTVWELESGISDHVVLAYARQKEAILVTADKDFGELIFRMGQAHCGVLLIRLSGLSPDEKARLVTLAAAEHGSGMQRAFTVISPGVVRVRRRTDK